MTLQGTFLLLLLSAVLRIPCALCLSNLAIFPNTVDVQGTVTVSWNVDDGDPTSLKLQFTHDGGSQPFTGLPSVNSINPHSSSSTRVTVQNFLNAQTIGKYHFNVSAQMVAADQSDFAPVNSNALSVGGTFGSPPQITSTSTTTAVATTSTSSTSTSSTADSTTSPNTASAPPPSSDQPTSTPVTTSTSSVASTSQTSSSIPSSRSSSASSTSSTSSSTTASSSSPSSSSTAFTDPNTPSQSSAPAHSKPIGAIVGATVGGLIAIVLAILALLCLQRRRNRGYDDVRRTQPFSPDDQAQPDTRHTGIFVSGPREEMDYGPVTTEAPQWDNEVVPPTYERVFPGARSDTSGTSSQSGQVRPVVKDRSGISQGVRVTTPSVPRSDGSRTNDGSSLYNSESALLPVR